MIGSRIKELRNQLTMTQQEFADRLGIKRNTVAQYEICRNEPQEAVINLICREFNVNETWLRTGEGEMFNDMSRADRLSSEFGRLMRISMSENPTEGERLKLKLISFLAQLDSDSWEVLAKIAAQWLDENKNSGE
jgi:transcriptional regulator with XRE-family HTH domain